MPTDTHSEPSVATVLYAAVQHVLDQIQENPDLGYYCGFGTQSFHLLTKAEAAYLGKPAVEVETLRRTDRQPSYRRHAPRVLVLEQAVTDARRDGFECDLGAIEREIVSRRSGE